MKHVLPEDEDARLRILFAAAAEPVADAGFSERVLERVVHTDRKRHLVLGTAGAVGFAVAAEPLWRIAQLAGEAMIVSPERYVLLGTWLGNPLVWAAVALVLLAFPALRWLED